MSFNYARTERTFFDDELKGHFDRLEGMGPDKAEVSLVSKTRDEATWVVSFRRDDGPTEYSLYDTASHKLTPLFVSQPALSDYKFAHMEDVRIQARDGLELVAYLTRAKADKPAIRPDGAGIGHGQIDIADILRLAGDEIFAEKGVGEPAGGEPDGNDGVIIDARFIGLDHWSCPVAQHHARRQRHAAAKKSVQDAKRMRGPDEHQPSSISESQPPPLHRDIKPPDS